MPATTGTQVLVVGEAIMDVVNGRPTPGGSATNVAVGLSRLGIDVALATYLGEDTYGQAMLAHLHDAGVEVIPGSVAADRTSTATATVTATGEVDYAFDVAWRTPDLSSAPEVGVLHIGSVPLLSDAGRAHLAERLSAGGHQHVTVDPNIRPELAPERSIAVDRFAEIARVASIVKLSDQDAAWLFPRQSPDSVVDELLELGARLVVLTRGPTGLTLASASARADVAAIPVEVRDTIGAGDTVMVSLIDAELAGRTRSLARDDLLRLGADAVQAAAVTVTRVGADMPYRHDLTPAGPAHAD